MTPADRSSAYVDAGLWRGEVLPDVFDRWVEQFGSRLAVVDADGDLTYSQLGQRVRGMAAGFANRGIGAGDRVIVQLPNTASFVVVLWALLECGAIPVLTLPAHRSREINHLGRLAQASAYVIPDVDGGFDYREQARDLVAHASTVASVFVDGDPGEFTSLADVTATPGDFERAYARDVALLLVSGGTTGLPKLIARTHNDYEYNARASADVCVLTAEDVYLVVLPAAHNFPLACPGILGALSVGATVVMTRDPSPDHTFALIEKHRVTVTALVPTLTHLWCEATEWEPADLSSLRVLQVGGAKLTPEVAKLVGPALGCGLQQVFGMAEGLLNFTRLDDDDNLILTTQGRPLSDLDEIRVVDSDGLDVEPGTSGELLTRGPYTIDGYYRAPEHNQTAITPDGYFRSGDLVRVLESGHLVVTGRIKDVITRGGENVAADELEDVLVTHPAISRVAVVGLPDQDLGESVCAVVVPTELPPTLADVRKFLVDSGCARYKLPDRLVLRRSLPTTAVGKIDKNALIAAASDAS